MWGQVSRREWLFFCTGRVEKAPVDVGQERETQRKVTADACTLETWNGHCELQVSNSYRFLESQVAAQSFPFQLEVALHVSGRPVQLGSDS